MNDAERREGLRRAIIQQAAYGMSQGGWGVDLPVLQANCKLLGKPPTQEEIIAAVAYLQGKGFIMEAPRKLSPVNKLWKITAEGMDFAEQEGLA